MRTGEGEFKTPQDKKRQEEEEVREVEEKKEEVCESFLVALLHIPLLPLTTLLPLPRPFSFSLSLLDFRSGSSLFLSIVLVLLAA